VGFSKKKSADRRVGRLRVFIPRRENVLDPSLKLEGTEAKPTQENKRRVPLKRASPLVLPGKSPIPDPVP